MTFKPEKPKEPKPKPGVEVDDHLYVQHQGQPCTGKVAAHGRHGVTVEIGGKHHKIKWEHVLGHKKRAQQRYKIIDQGEDGMLVEDDHGRRRFIGVPNESKEDPMVAKSFDARRPVLLFSKSEPSTGAPPGPGLQKKQITDKNGVQTTKWVRVDQKGPPAQRGQHVGFQNGEHRGHGQVIASGKHGVTVRDGAGGEHRVHHEKVTHHWKGDGAPDASPHEPEKAGTDAGGDHLFSPDQVASLPEKVNQPVNTWEDLVKHGTEGLAQFKDMMGKVQTVMGLKAGMRPDDITPEQWENDEGFMFIAPLKGEKRAKEKVESDYGGDWSQLRDIVRGTISLPTMGHVKQAIGHLQEAGIQLAQKPKDRFAKPTSEGYRDLMTFVKLPNGMLAELQIHVKAMTLAKEKGHKDYEITRSLQGKYNEGEPSDKWHDDDHTKFYEAQKRQKQIYSEAWNKANGSAEKTLIKSDQTPTMRVLFLRSPK